METASTHLPCSRVGVPKTYHTRFRFDLSKCSLISREWYQISNNQISWETWTNSLQRYLFYRWHPVSQAQTSSGRIRMVPAVVEFFPACQDFGISSTSQSPPALFFSFLFFFLMWKLPAHTNSSLPLCRDQFTVAQMAETTVAKCFLTSCVWARFRIGSHTMPGPN